MIDYEDDESILPLGGDRKWGVKNCRPMSEEYKERTRQRTKEWIANNRERYKAAVKRYRSTQSYKLKRSEYARLRYQRLKEQNNGTGQTDPR